MEIPAISVIIPLYNAEKYVGDCLESILGQTFTDFEVIVVDDCSTDNSAAIVESYAEKFGGRLRLIKTKKNSGNAGYTARNKGFSFSRGEYVWFVDADDFVTNTALEELYTAAKCYMILNGCIDYCFSHNIEARFQVSSDKVYKILRREFENKGESDLIIPFFFSLVDDLQKNLLVADQQLKELPKKNKAKLADFEIRDKYNKAYITELEKFALQAQQRINELENELQRRK